jgi:uncharacterized membrane protein YfcA
METAGYIASIFVGVVLGLLGGGGSILSIPILVYLFGIDPVLASAYSLFIVGTTSLVGTISKYKQRLLHLRTGLIFGIPSIFSIFATRKWVVPAIPEIVLVTESFILTKRILVLGIFALLMITASFSMIRGSAEITSGNDTFKTHWVILQGVLIGFLTGLVGAGGGFLIIPALVFLTGLKFKIAAGTSLFIIAINSLTGFMGDVLNYTLDWFFLISITALAVVGILIGGFFSRKISGMHLRKAFGWLTLVMGSWILVKELLL